MLLDVLLLDVVISFIAFILHIRTCIDLIILAASPIRCSNFAY